MRVSGGRARGVALSVSKKSVHRPAMDRLRQGVFSSLGARIENARVADLFAGTGSYGLEALSRGAASASFVEINRSACSMIRTNIDIVAKSMGSAKLQGSVICGDATKAGTLLEPHFDLIFVDPPYDRIESMAPALFNAFDRLVSQSGLVVFEAPGRIELSHDNWSLQRRLGKGRDQPTACVFKRASLPTQSNSS